MTRALAQASSLGRRTSLQRGQKPGFAPEGTLQAHRKPGLHRIGHLQQPCKPVYRPDESLQRWRKPGPALCRRLPTRWKPGLQHHCSVHRSAKPACFRGCTVHLPTHPVRPSPLPKIITVPKDPESELKCPTHPLQSHSFPGRHSPQREPHKRASVRNQGPSRATTRILTIPCTRTLRITPFPLAPLKRSAYLSRPFLSGTL
jgi:hypothetical protein